MVRRGGGWRWLWVVVFVVFGIGWDRPVEARPLVRSFARVTGRLVGEVTEVWSLLDLPQLISAVFDREIFDYEMLSGTKVRVTYANNDTMDLELSAQSPATCSRSCFFEYKVTNDNIAGYTGPVTLMFLVQAAGSATRVTIGYRLDAGANQRAERRWGVRIPTMLDNLYKYFRPSRCNTHTPPITGVCNSMYYVISGTQNQQLLRMKNQHGMNMVVNPRYEDGMRSPRNNGMPNPRTVSNRLAKHPTTRTNFKLSQLFVTFGQLIDHDIILTPGGGNGKFKDNSMNIRVTDSSDPVFGDGVILFGRSAYDRRDMGNNGYEEVLPRQHLNAVTAFVDASMVYGSTYDRRYLRSFKDGQMFTNTTATGVHCPNNDPAHLGLSQEMDPDPEDHEFLAAGDARANENPLLLSLHTLFVREHNRIATLLKKSSCTSCNDELIFNLARRVVITEMQIITFDEWLPLLLGKKIPYRGYNAKEDAGIMQEFSTAAMRFGHSMQAETLWLIANGQTESSRTEIDLKDSFFNPKLVKDNGIEPFILGASMQTALPFDHLVTDSLRNFLFTNTPLATGVDLFSLNLQRGRDHGLPSYNEARMMCGLPWNTFRETAGGNAAIASTLKDLYKKEAKIDLFVGGILEPRVGGGELGATFRCIVEKQFESLMHGDRFFYKQPKVMHQPLLRNPEIRRIVKGQFNLRTLILKNTDISSSQLPLNVFKRP